ncbi:MAG TPA: hypothetical protein VN428_16400 [Bryobacteraceae bacterium]|nr:hypothetical protein [Bryobacteraceae bacterium]
MNGLGLIAASVAAGVLMLAAFGRFSDQAAVRKAKARVWAHLYELRLFGDEPSLMLRANRNLLAANARYLGLMLKPAAVILIPAALLMWQLDRVYGTRPFERGETAVASVRGERPVLTPPPGFVVETPAVRVPSRGVAYWRVRATRTASFEPAGNADVPHPPATVAIAGVHAHWLVWFLVTSAVTMLALRRRFRVTF